MAKKYAQVRFRAEDGSKNNVLMEVTREVDNRIIGYEVERSGLRVLKSTRGGSFDRIVVIDKSDILKWLEMRMHPRYATLEPCTTPD